MRVRHGLMTHPLEFRWESLSFSPKVAAMWAKSNLLPNKKWLIAKELIHKIVIHISVVSFII